MRDQEIVDITSLASATLVTACMASFASAAATGAATGKAGAAACDNELNSAYCRRGSAISHERYRIECRYSHGYDALATGV